jgi:hypothetical protein
MGSMMFVRSFLGGAMALMPPVGALACEGLPGTNIQIIAKSEPAVLASGLSLSEIDQLARHTGYVGKGPRLGFYFGHFSDTVSIGVEPEPKSNCAGHIQVEVHMLLVDRHIEIGRELRQQPCLFEVARQHYEKKATADEMVFAQYVAVVTTALHSNPLPAMSASVDHPPDEAARQQINRWATTLVEQSLQSFYDARIVAQEAVDTPEELKRLGQACEKGTRRRPVVVRRRVAHMVDDIRSNDH